MGIDDTDGESDTVSRVEIDVPRNPARMRAIQCVSCGSSVRPVLRPTATAVEAVGKPRNREAYRGVDVPAQFTCPVCAADMEREMKAIQSQLATVLLREIEMRAVDGQWVSDIDVPKTDTADDDSESDPESDSDSGSGSDSGE